MEDLLTQDHHETGRYNTDDGITGCKDVTTPIHILALYM